MELTSTLFSVISLAHASGTGCTVTGPRLGREARTAYTIITTKSSINNVGITGTGMQRSQRVSFAPFGALLLEDYQPDTR